MSEFIKLQLKLSWGFNKDDSKKSTILTGVIGLIVAFVMLAIVYLFASVLISNMPHVSIKKISTLFLTFVEIALLVMSITMQIKRIYRPNDLLISARFPLSDFKMYVANIILVYINLAIYGFLLVFPVMLTFGLSAHIFGFKLIAGAIIGSIVAPLVPFALSLIIAVPIMYILSLIENRNILKLCIFVVVLVGLFVLYDYVLSVLAKYFIEDHGEIATVGVWEGVIKWLNYLFNPGACLSGIVFFDGFWAGIGITIGVVAVFGTAGIFLSAYIYKRMRRRILEGGGSNFSKVTKLDDHGSSRAMFGHGFKNILRTRTYTYFYLGIAIATPVMVFLCNKLISEVGQERVGSLINFGASLLVIAAFLAMISAFAGVSISMEGKKFYITKIIPVGYRKQMILKALLNFIVSMGALVISLIILISMRFINVAQLFVLLVSMMLLSAGFVLNGLNINLKNPSLKQKVNGETDEINITLTMLIGLFLAALLGFSAIIVPFAIGLVLTYFIILGTSVIYALVNFLVFWFTCEKKYSKIEV